MPDSIERRIPDYPRPSSDSNITFPHDVRQDGRNPSGWSFSGQNQIAHGVANVEHGGQSLSTTNIGAVPRLEEIRHETTNVQSLEDVSLNHHNNQVSNGPPFLRNTGSAHILLNLDLNAGYAGNNGGEDVETSSMPLLYKSGETEPEQIPSVGGSTSPSSAAGNFTEEGDGRPGSSSDGRRTCCKRKAVEGTSAQSSLDASPSCPQFAETVLQNNAPGPYNAGGSLSISAPAANLPRINAPVRLQPRPGVGRRGLDSDNHQALHLAGNTENRRINPAYQQHSAALSLAPIWTAIRHCTVWPPNQQDSAALSLAPIGTAIRHSTVWPPHQLPVGGFLPFTQSSNAGQTTGSPSGTQLQSDMINTSRHLSVTHPFPWNGASGSGVGSSSSSPVIPRTAPLQVISSISMPGHMPEPTIVASSAEIRNWGQDTTIWSLPNGNVISAGVSASANLAASSQAVPSSHPQASSAPMRLLHPNPPGQYLQMFPPLVTSSVQAYASQAGPRNVSRAGPSSGTQPSSIPSWVTHPNPPGRPYPRPTLRLQQIRGPLPFRTSTATNDGRIRIVSEGAVMVQQPLFFRVAGEPDVPDSPDRHSDMRLDVDNMSYEQLLELEERIGNVKTGLSAETILTYLKQQKYPSVKIGGISEVEPCCICREEYVNGDAIGVLECAHAFHTDCIKQWLMQKNVCPVCKTTALVT